MTMKHRATRRAFLALLVFAVPACDDGFLTESPVDFLGPENFYRNASDALAAVNAAYAALEQAPSGETWPGINSTQYYGWNMYIIHEYSSEALTSRFGHTHDLGQFDSWNVTPSNPALYGTWNAIYHAINRTNAVIDNVPGITNMDSALRDRVVGEAKFLRGLHYFNLVGLFGRVPLQLTEVRSLTAARDLAPQASEAEVYAQIIQDLEQAAAVLPVKSQYASSDFGRATKGAAQTLLGKVYLHRGQTGVGSPADFANAAEQLRAVMASGEYSLDPNYGSLFNGTNERSREMIFSLQHIRSSGRGGSLTSLIGPQRSGLNGTNNGFQVEFPFYHSYDPKDKRRDASWVLEYTRANGTRAFFSFDPNINPNVTYGSTGPVPEKLWDRMTTGTGQDEPDYPILRYADVLLMLAEAINEISGPTGEAVALINEVRMRSGLDPLPAAATAGKAAFKDAIFLERRYEFVMEGHAYFDTQRHWEWATNRIEAHMRMGLPVAEGGQDANAPPFTRSVPPIFVDIPDRYKHWPIPDRAIELNTGLTQNPGW